MRLGEEQVSWNGRGYADQSFHWYLLSLRGFWLVGCMDLDLKMRDKDLGVVTL